MTVTEIVINSEPKKLPDGWRWVRLGDICDINPSRPVGFNRAPDALTTFVPMQAVDEHRGMILNAETKPFSEVAKGYTFFGEGDILFAKITPCMQNGKHAIAKGLIDGIGFGSTEFHVIRPRAGVNPEWIHRFVRQPHILSAAANHFTGAVGQQRVPESFLASLEIPLPSINEQERIAGILNEQMATVEKAWAAAEVRLEAAKALTKAYIRGVFESEEAKRWRRVRLGDIGPVTDGDWILSTDYAPNGVRLLQVGDVGVGRFIGKSSRFITEARAKELNCTFLHAGDILISRMPDPIGRACILPSLGYSTITAVDVSIFHPDETKANRDFLISYFCSAEWFQRVLSLASGATRPRISRSNLEQLEIPLPSLPEQRDIAARLTDKMTALEIMLHSIQQELDSITALPAALLRRAFSGGM